MMLTATQYACMSPEELIDHLQEEFDTPLTNEVVRRFGPVTRTYRPRYKLEELLDGHDHDA
jgi:hypothetical protein